MRHLHQPFEQSESMPARITLRMVKHFYEERALWADMIQKAFPGKKGKHMRDLLEEMPDPSKNWMK